MLDSKALEDVLAFRSERYLVTSLYLDVDGRRHPRNEFVTVFRDLCKARGAKPGVAADREQARSCADDLARIEEFLLHRFDRGGFRGLALFACSGEGLFRPFPLAVRVRDRLTVEPVAYLRPLQAILEARRRVGVVLVDQRRARLFESGEGEIRAIEEIEHDVPSRVRAGGFQGYEESRIDRHVMARHHAHYRDVAERLFAHHRREKFDHVVVAGPREDAAAFEGHLHPFLQDRLAGRIVCEMAATRPEIARKVEAIEAEILRGEKDARVEKLLEQAGRGGLGVVGLAPTLAALGRSQVRSLFVREDFELPGQVCLECRALGVEEQVCPRCEEAMTAVEDVIDEAVEEAVRQGATVYAVRPDHDAFSRAGSIGALLRFRD